jgi:hypothetical protein
MRKYHGRGLNPRLPPIAASTGVAADCQQPRRTVSCGSSRRNPDIVAHGLWVAAGAEWLRRRKRLTTRGVAGAIALGVAPDLIQTVPVAVWAASTGDDAALLAYIVAVPGGEPPMPAAVATIAHHLRCFMHSAIIAGAVTAVARVVLKRFPFVLLGWWAHIALDVPPHSSAYYAVPIFYPITYCGFGGVAWTTPWLAALNYILLAVAFAWLDRTRDQHHEPRSWPS